MTEETKDKPEKEQVQTERQFCDKMLSDQRLKMKVDSRGGNSCKGMIVDLMLMGKMPHMVAVLATLVCTGLIIWALFSIIGGSVSAFFDLEKCATDEEFNLENQDTGRCVDGGFAVEYDPEAETMSQKLTAMGNSMIETLEESGTKILERGVYDYGHPTDEACIGEACINVQRKNATAYTIVPSQNDVAPRYTRFTKQIQRYKDSEPETAGLQSMEWIDRGSINRYDSDLVATVTILNLWQYEPLPWKENCTGGELCARKMPIFGGPDLGTPWGDLMSYVGAVANIINFWVVILMLAMFIIMERPEGKTVSGDHPVLEEIEDMIKNYINLKTILSFVTGVAVAVFLLLSQTPLGMIFGLASFLLNFIPNVGSAIACLVPIPVILLSNQSTLQKSVAIGGPMMVQLYVGNALEPQVFGEALNLTAISILLALVVFSFMWGLSGAVLSVPFLGIMKITAHHTDHPQAKYFLSLIREMPEVDVEKDAMWKALREQRAEKAAADAVYIMEKEKEFGIFEEDEEAQD
eukprot:SAG11_NODE_520_length_8780_cov_13.076719_4_plen_522_part_00